MRSNFKNITRITLIFIVFYGLASKSSSQEKIGTGIIEENITIKFNVISDTVFRIKKQGKRVESSGPIIIGIYSITNNSKEIIEVYNWIGYEYDYCQFYLEAIDSLNNSYKDKTWTADFDYWGKNNAIKISPNCTLTDTLHFDCYRFTKIGNYKIRLVYNLWNKEMMNPSVIAPERIRVKSNWIELKVKK